MKRSLFRPDASLPEYIIGRPMNIELKSLLKIEGKIGHKLYSDPASLQKSLSLIDDFFGIEDILADSNSDIVNQYYKQSLRGYSQLYNRWQCMHVALHENGNSEKQAYFAQAAEISNYLSEPTGLRVLELGCGLGANVVQLATQHDNVEFVGIDMMPEYVKRANVKLRSLENASVICANYETLPANLGTFDVIFAVETLCYATDLDRVAAKIAHLLRPGGRVVVFDAHRKLGFDTLAPDLVTATRLYEVATAVSQGFHTEGAWESSFATAGLNIVMSEDITAKTLHGLSSLHNRSMKAYTDKKWRLTIKFMPRYLARNTVPGLLGYHVCFGPNEQPDPDQGAVRYQKIVAQKPS